MIAQCVQIYFSPFRYLPKKVSRRKTKRSSSEISDDKLTFLYITLDFQGFKTGLTAVVQMDIFAVLIHCVQFKFIMLNTLQEDFIFYLHLPVLSETLLFIKHENHKMGWNLPF